MRLQASRRHLARAVLIASTVVLLGLSAWSYRTQGIVYVLLQVDGTAEQKVQALRAFFSQLGAAAPLAYVALVIIEVVVAPLPGTMLYAPGGILFGGFWGGLLSLVGNVIGAGMACQLARCLLGGRVRDYLGKSGLARYEERLEGRGFWVIFLLRVNPFTSSDLVSYAAGLTRLPTHKVMLGTAAGLTPLCFLQAYLAEGLLSLYPGLLYPVLIVCAMGTVAALWILSRLLLRDPPVA